ncbi:MAG: ChaN family lipoprotein, partial [Thermodesulfobacteriota bacterium]|nr:ChaN family lipoprotein [Thermodesulfobacteriota bacterium]
MKTLVSFFAMAGLLLHSVPGCTHDLQEMAIIQLKNGRQLSLPEIVGDLKGVSMVFVGELHNNAEHHEIQLAVIRALAKAGASVAVGVEMFRQGSQKDLDRWVSAKLSEKDFERIYKENWSHHWHLY